MTAALVQRWGGESPKRYAISVDDALLSDLRRRLEATRWPDEIFDSNWVYGTDLHYLKNLVDKSFTVAIEDLHFIHEPGEGSTPFPLLLTAGRARSLSSKNCFRC